MRSRKSSSLYQSFSKQQKNQKQVLNDLLVLVQYAIEKSKIPIFDAYLEFSNLYRQEQDKLIELMNKDETEENKDSLDKRYFWLKLLETDQSIDVISKVFREIEMLMNLIYSLQEENIKKKTKIIENGLDYSDLISFINNSPEKLMFEYIYNIANLDEFSLSEEELRFVHQVYDWEREFLSSLFSHIPKFCRFAIQIRNNYFHKAMWIPELHIEEISHNQKENVMHKAGHSIPYLIPLSRRMENNVIKYSENLSGIRLTKSLILFVNAVLVTQQIIINYYLTNLHQDQRFVELLVTNKSNQHHKKYHNICKNYCEYVDIKVEINSYRGQVNNENFQHQMQLLKEIENFNETFHPKFLKNRKKGGKQTKVKSTYIER